MPMRMPFLISWSGGGGTSAVASVDPQQDASGVAGRVGGEVEGGAHDLVDLTTATQGECLGVAGELFHVPGLTDVAEEGPGHDGVDPHGRAECVRQCLGQ